MTDVERVRVYEKDHAPDGFPAVEMALLTRLADRVVELQEDLAWKERAFKKCTSANNYYRTSLCVNSSKMIALKDGGEDVAIDPERVGDVLEERDALREKLARAKKFLRPNGGQGEAFDHYWIREVEEGGA